MEPFWFHKSSGRNRILAQVVISWSGPGSFARRMNCRLLPVVLRAARLLPMSKTPPTPPSNKPSQGWLARLQSVAGGVQKSGRQHSRWRVTVLLAMAAMMVPLVAGVGLWMLQKRPKPVAKPLPTIAEAQQSLEQGDYERARRIALIWNQTRRLPKAQRFWPPYILGQVAIHEAEPLEGPDKVELYALAAASLKRARGQQAFRRKPARTACFC